MKKNNLNINYIILEAGAFSFIAGLCYKKICFIFHIHYESLNTVIFYALFVLSILLFITSYSRFNIIFRKTNLGINGIYPMKISRKRENDLTIYKFTLPAGLSTNDIEKKQIEIEQFLGKRIKIRYLYKRTFEIKVFNYY